MRRISVFLALAAILLSAAVGYIYRIRVEKANRHRQAPTPQIDTKYDARALAGWNEYKDDPVTNKPIVRVHADSFQGTRDPSTVELHNLWLKLYTKDGSKYTYVKGEKAFYDEGSGMLTSASPVFIVINVPADKDAEDKADQSKRVRVTTSGVKYDTKSGHVSTDQLASFVFSDGDGQAVGGEYDPNSHELHLKSQIALDWIGKGPLANKIHVETGELVYKESEQKVYLSPWAKMKRETTTVQSQSAVVTLDDGVLQKIDADHGFGTDDREDKHTDFSADQVTTLFDENGNIVNIVATNNARVVTVEPGTRTTMNSDRADMRFAVSTKQVNGHDQSSSDLHLVLADGHGQVESVPRPQPGVQLADTRILRSEHIELEMKPGGKDVHEIRTSSQAQIEFKPNRPEQPHRVVDASHVRIIYGEGSYVDSFLAWNVRTHTDKAVVKMKPNTKPEPALTWSDELSAKFTPNSNQVAHIEQTGNFRYEEGTRKASAKKAILEQTINRMTLVDNARVLDDTGSAIADTIVMDQESGDMDAKGHVFSTHAPDKNQKPGTSMLDDSKTMQATADAMSTRENNTKVHYDGHAVMWQGANRIAANTIDVDRDTQTLHAVGNVISELVDNKSNPPAPDPNAKTQGAPQQTASTPPIFTVVQAPELNYRDDTRIAIYTGGVKLTREKMNVTSKEMKAFLTPKTDSNKDQSSLDHAFADGDVSVFDVLATGVTRTGTGQHCEYYTQDDKVILNGGGVQMVDSHKGVTKGRQLTYFSGDDHLIVDGLKNQLAFTDMKKH